MRVRAAFEIFAAFDETYSVIATIERLADLNASKFRLPSPRLIDGYFAPAVPPEVYNFLYDVFVVGLASIVLEKFLTQVYSKLRTKLLPTFDANQLLALPDEKVSELEQRIIAEKDRIDRAWNLQGRTYCVYCGTIISIRANFCHVCGRKVPRW